MKIKSLITFSILFALSFSMVHEYAFAFYDDEHCNVAEYISEIEAPSSHGDVCDIHFEYHQAFLLPQDTILPTNNDMNSKPVPAKDTYQFHVNLDFIKPPIS